jgi:hypothetical protein
MNTADRPDLQPHPYRAAATPSPALRPGWRRRLVDALPFLRSSLGWRRWAGGRWAYGHAALGFDPLTRLVMAGRLRWVAVEACPCDAFPVTRCDDPGGSVSWISRPCRCEVHA